MIIVSQDKEKIVNFNNLTQIYITQDEEETAYYIRFETVGSLYDDLGEYKAEERAKEVLNAIGAYYGICKIYKCGEKSDRLMIDKFAIERGTEPFIFPMPEE